MLLLERAPLVRLLTAATVLSLVAVLVVGVRTNECARQRDADAALRAAEAARADHDAEAARADHEAEQARKALEELRRTLDELEARGAEISRPCTLGIDDERARELEQQLEEERDAEQDLRELVELLNCRQRSDCTLYSPVY